MLEPKSPSDKLLFATIRIVTNDASGNESVGTGFFFEYPTGPNQTLLLLITNKHVIRGAVNGNFLLHHAITNENGKGVPSGRFVNVALDQFEDRWILHPNSDIDLCALNFTPYLLGENSSVHLVITSIFRNQILSDPELSNLGAIEDIVMIGYPRGIWDEVNNLPLIRSGITATHPGVDFQGRSLGVVDIACFPGSSGSPILIFNESTYYDRSTNTVILGTRSILLGVLFAGPSLTAEGLIVPVEIPTRTENRVLTPMMINLGYYIKAKELITLAERVRSMLESNRSSQ